MQIEGKVYSLAETKENYMNFFQDVFNFANEARKSCVIKIFKDLSKSMIFSQEKRID